MVLVLISGRLNYRVSGSENWMGSIRKYQPGDKLSIPAGKAQWLKPKLVHVQIICKNLMVILVSSWTDFGEALWCVRAESQELQ